MADCDNDCSLIDYIKNSQPTCGGYELENCSDTATIVDLVDEHLNIGAATVNVFKLLGIHEQGKLLDVTGNGMAISGGDGPGYPAENAYNKLCGTWRSVQRGPQTLTHAFLGYDFGEIVDSSTNATYYGINTFSHKHIATLRIQQGSSAKNRATKVRVERSMDGNTWLGASVVTLPDDGDLHQISLKGSSASRYWRIRPTAFNGGTADFWEIVRLELHEYEETQLSNLQYDGGFLENRDRDYAEASIPMKMYYELTETQTQLTQFGMELDDQQMFFTVSFKTSVLTLGRPIVIGDILELPTEIQYTSDLRAVNKYVEVTDVSWSVDGYTPGWQPTLQRIVTAPMLASQETMDITGDYHAPADDIGFVDVNTANIQDYTNIVDRNQAEQDLSAPERGKDTHAVRTFSDEEIVAAKTVGIDLGHLNLNQRAVYVEDGLPPNNEYYTEGEVWPKTPSDGDWHRMTYSRDSLIPARLFKYNGTKKRWVYQETDRREQYNLLKPTIQEALLNSTKLPSSEAAKNGIKS